MGAHLYFVDLVLGGHAHIVGICVDPVAIEDFAQVGVCGQVDEEEGSHLGDGDPVKVGVLQLPVELGGPVAGCHARGHLCYVEDAHSPQGYWVNFHHLVIYQLHQTLWLLSPRASRLSLYRVPVVREGRDKGRDILLVHTEGARVSSPFSHPISVLGELRIVGEWLGAKHLDVLGHCHGHGCGLGLLW